MPKLGDVLTSKDKQTGEVREGSYYLKVSLKDGETVTLRNGDIIDLKTREAYFAGLVEAGYMSAEQKQERIDKMPEFVKLIASVNKNKIDSSNVTAIVGTKAAF